MGGGGWGKNDQQLERPELELSHQPDHQESGTAWLVFWSEKELENLNKANAYSTVVWPHVEYCGSEFSSSLESIYYWQAK